MRTTRRLYSAEFRHRLFDLVRGGQSPEELALKFEPSANAIRNWGVQAARDKGRRAEALPPTRRRKCGACAERCACCGKNARSARAAAWFAKETTSIPSRDSSS